MVKSAETCMKCGFCMSVCPVYLTDRVETHVARGRNMLINTWLKGLIPNVISYKEALYFCILCGRCQSVCPAKVPNVEITLKARSSFVEESGLGIIQKIVYQLLLHKRGLLTGLLRLISRVPGLSKKDAPPLRHLADSFFLVSRPISIPKLRKPFLRERFLVQEEQNSEIAFFPGCAFEFIYPQVGEKVLRLFKNLGLNVEYPQGLLCCGYPVYCAGDTNTAKKIALRNMKILSKYKLIITACATCVSGLRGYKDWFKEADKKRLAENISSKVVGFSEFLIKEKVSINSKVSNLVVTYHDPCHMKWHQGIYEEPRKVLNSIAGIRFVEMENADMCCGLGGAFGITHRDISLRLQEKKIESIKKTKAHIVATECPGCMLQIAEGIKRFSLPVQIRHIAELL